MKKLINFLADQIDIGHGWIGNLISALIVTAMAIGAMPLYIESIVHFYEQWNQLSQSEKLTICLFFPPLPFVAIMAPLALFELVRRRWKERKRRR
jgi:hypothetical protein